MVVENCWEFKKCGREPGGERTRELGICPATTSGFGDNLNHGKCRGRICWAVAGTFCEDTVQGSFAKKRQTCLTCDFYNKVVEEEDKDFEMLLPLSDL